jgi:hypothetical protein
MYRDLIEYPEPVRMDGGQHSPSPPTPSPTPTPPPDPPPQDEGPIGGG